MSETWQNILMLLAVVALVVYPLLTVKAPHPRITSYNVCYTKLLRIFGKRELLLSKTAGSPSGDQKGACPARADEGDGKDHGERTVRLALPLGL